MTKHLTALFLAALGSSVGAQAIDFNGFAPGMTRAAAKAIGYGQCRQAEDRDPVICTVSASRLTWHGIPIDKAELEFKPPQLDRVASVTLTSPTREADMLAALRQAYGQPFADQRRIVFVGSNDVLASTSRYPSIGTRITLTRQSGVFKAQQQAASDRKAKQERLKNF